MYFPSLDGIRGIAAIAVVMFHIGHWLHWPGMAANAGLAIDLFFCLSGFVLAHSYKARFDAGMTPILFTAVRILRLFPLIAIATLISAAYVLIRVILQHEALSESSLFFAMLLGSLNVPFFHASETLGGPQIFPLNGPQYTLFFEFFVNIFWSFTYRYNSAAVLLVIVSSSLLIFAIIGVGGDVANTFFYGFPRVFSSFYIGYYIYLVDQKMASRRQVNALFWVLLAGMIWVLFMPWELPLTFEIFWIAAISPLIVFSGARMTLNGFFQPVSLFLGAISYPVYVLHYPIFCWVNGIYQFTFGEPDVFWETLIVSIRAGPQDFGRRAW